METKNPCESRAENYDLNDETVMDYTGGRLYPITDRLGAIKELLDPTTDEELELSVCGRRGLAYLIEDIGKLLYEAAAEIDNEVRDHIKRALAKRGQTQNGKGSKGLVGEQALRGNLTKAEGVVN